MANNKPLRKYKTLEWLTSKAATATGLNWFLAVIAPYVVRWLASQGVYFIDVGSTYIQTNMDDATWVKVNGESYAKVEAGVTPEQGVKIDNEFISAFDNVAVFNKVQHSKNN